MVHRDADADTYPGPYNLRRVLREAQTQLPVLVLNHQHVLPGLLGPERLAPATRIAVQLRLARMLGCPVCVGLFPAMARRAGLSGEGIRSALEGRSAGLSEEQYGAVAWAEAILLADGEPPLHLPEAAWSLSDAQRSHIHWFIRLELLVHATGLLFLPHALIERAAWG